VDDVERAPYTAKVTAFFASGLRPSERNFALDLDVSLP
jgi:hypothetical protein